MSEPTLPYESKEQNKLPSPQRICSKCSGAMTQGFIPDISQAAALQQTWVEGAPEKSFWTVTKVRHKPTYFIETYRCEQCGALELYALRRKK